MDIWIRDNLKSNMTFKTWIMRYKNKDNPMGDLARDIADDQDFPDSTDMAEVGLYLMGKHPCLDCVRVFRTASKQYMTWLMKEIFGDA